MITIALDAMGGDFAPRVPVEAALRAVKGGGLRVILVGEQGLLEKTLAELLKKARYRLQNPGDALRIHHTPQFLAQDDAPSALLREKKQASVRVACELVRDGQAEAVVSAGHSGGLMVAAKHALGLIPGVDRPAIATPLPLKRGALKADAALLLDSGANVDCKAEYLVQFAQLGACYARQLLHVASPRVALLSNGEEAGKGNALVRTAHPLLEAQVAGFIGNVEGRDIFRGRADVIVTDGFVGNLVLKTAEAAGRQLRVLLKESLARSPQAWVGYWLLRPLLFRLLGRTDYREIGGSPLLGVNGVALVCHGASNALALAKALELARECVANTLPQALTEEFATGRANKAQSKEGP